MSDTDIYKNREPVQNEPGNVNSKKRHHRRSASLTAFGETGNRRRRSKNSGLRRILHLSRKSANEKHFWWSLLGITIAILLVIAIWQFWYLEDVAREQAHMDEQHVPIQTTSESATE